MGETHVFQIEADHKRSALSRRAADDRAIREATRAGGHERRRPRRRDVLPTPEALPAAPRLDDALLRQWRSLSTAFRRSAA